MDGYPNLYADLGVEMWLHPTTKYFVVKFLKSAKEYGFYKLSLKNYDIRLKMKEFICVSCVI
jgi:hypothetical protein